MWSCGDVPPPKHLWTWNVMKTYMVKCHVPEPKIKVPKNREACAYPESTVERMKTTEQYEHRICCV